MSSTIVITIPAQECQNINYSKKSYFQSLCSLVVSCLGELDKRRVIHSLKMGIALVLASLLYIVDPLYNRVGDNVMWAIMTVVVVFEFSAGATISKGINRGIGTILGGGFGCLAAFLTREVGGSGTTGNAISIGISVFIFGAVATYTRLVPKIKKRYDYGVLVFILTFNLILNSSFRMEKIIEMARIRLSMITIGFAICVFTSLLVFPIWASDDLHQSIASKFQKLASSIEGCLEDYYNSLDEKEKQLQTYFSPSTCKMIINSKLQDESLANFARWEPWHGKFGLSHPWGKYLLVGEVLRELASVTLTLKECLKSTGQPSPMLRESIKEQCGMVGSSLVFTLHELGDSIMKMHKCQSSALVSEKLQSMRFEMYLTLSPSRIGPLENVDEMALASLAFLLGEIVDKVEQLSKQVEELGEVAGFRSK